MNGKCKEEILYGGKSPYKIALIPLKGQIVGDEPSARSSGATSPDRMELYFALAGRDPAVKAVVLEISSPGGTASASDEIYAQISAWKLAKKKPVVAFIRDLGASGAYYVASAADLIVASPQSLVGSIGVVTQIIQVRDALEKLGIKTHVFTSGDLKAAGSPFSDLTQAAKQQFENLIKETYLRFLAVVKTGRPLIAPQDLAEISRGGIYSANEAKRLHLVDEIGYRASAIKTARTLANVPDSVPTIVRYRMQRSPFEDLLRIAKVLNPTAKVFERLELESSGQLLYLWDPSIM